MNEQQLITRRMELAQNMDMTNAERADAWNKLSADFAALGMTSNAALCESNWKRYQDAADFERMTPKEQKAHWLRVAWGVER